MSNPHARSRSSSARTSSRGGDESNPVVFILNWCISDWGLDRPISTGIKGIILLSVLAPVSSFILGVTGRDCSPGWNPANAEDNSRGIGCGLYRLSKMIPKDFFNSAKDDPSRDFGNWEDFDQPANTTLPQTRPQTTTDPTQPGR